MGGCGRRAANPPAWGKFQKKNRARNNLIDCDGMRMGSTCNRYGVSHLSTKTPPNFHMELARVARRTSQFHLRLTIAIPTLAHPPGGAMVLASHNSHLYRFLHAGKFAIRTSGHK